jgi:hypothetical protein
VSGCQWSVVSCQLSVVSCQLSVVSCQLSVVSCQLSVVSCQWSVVSCQLSVVSCQWFVVCGSFVASYWVLPWRVTIFRHHVSLSPWGGDFARRDPNIRERHPREKAMSKVSTGGITTGHEEHEGIPGWKVGCHLGADAPGAVRRRIPTIPFRDIGSPR